MEGMVYMVTKQEETFNRITVRRSDDGGVIVEATAPLTLYGIETYEGNIFDGYSGGNRYCGASWRIGNAERTHIPFSQFCTSEEAEQFLVSLAKLALAANGVTV